MQFRALNATATFQRFGLAFSQRSSPWKPEMLSVFDCLDRTSCEYADHIDELCARWRTPSPARVFFHSTAAMSCILVNWDAALSAPVTDVERAFIA